MRLVYGLSIFNYSFWMINSRNVKCWWRKQKKHKLKILVKLTKRIVGKGLQTLLDFKFIAQFRMKMLIDLKD